MIRLDENVRVKIQVGDEEVTAVFPGYDSPEMIQATQKLLSGRFVMARGGRAPQDKSFDARVRFFDSVVLDIEGVEVPDGTGGFMAMGEAENWKARVPANWKVSFASQFEEKSALNEEDRGN